MTREEELERKRATARVFYAKNREKLNAKAKQYRLANAEKVKAYAVAKRAMPKLPEDIEHDKELRAIWYQKNIESRAEYSRQYNKANAEKLKVYRKEYLKKKKVKDAEYLASIRPPAVSLDNTHSTLIARAAIAKHLVISMVALDRLARTSRYEMPKHVSVHVNGSYLYNRKAMEEWYPYARELMSWAIAGERSAKSRRPFAFKAGTLGHAMIMFMRNNEKVIAHCTKERVTLRMKFVGGL